MQCGSLCMLYFFFFLSARHQNAVVWIVTIQDMANFVALHSGCAGKDHCRTSREAQHHYSLEHQYSISQKNPIHLFRCDYNNLNWFVIVYIRYIILYYIKKVTYVLLSRHSFHRKASMVIDRMGKYQLRWKRPKSEIKFLIVYLYSAIMSVARNHKMAPSTLCTSGYDKTVTSSYHLVSPRLNILSTTIYLHETLFWCFSWLQYIHMTLLFLNLFSPINHLS